MPQSPDMSRALSPTRVLARFAVRVTLLATFAAFGSIGFGKSLAALLWMSIILCSVVGLIKREPLFGATLNHWDEGVAFGALFALIHIVN
ncbi:hypothetical protein QA641_10630 [Bradyrhizobium sp. CB1650]|uniref:hypothetical protein n=1 Tax=Bradyrhizobium sp. CB1650 TaxID=3039153 RepID=UPI00243561E0|nr:hypothetical protein [Bradyrhizobium sp. CB1650]WGD54310.1 hypothetical protein QA641_10630 [Bradyrhizobium sp. CB1650]